LCGKHVVGPDPEAALARVGASTIVCLVERHEVESRYPAYVEWLRSNAGGRAVWHPIHDLHAPAVDAALPFVGGLTERLRAGEHLVVHCGAGIGRAGTVAACVLIAMGAERADALATVAASRPGAGPEVGPQLELVERVAVAYQSLRLGVVQSRDARPDTRPAAHHHPGRP
jgi:protein-tyrosine phosphatase